MLRIVCAAVLLSSSALAEDPWVWVRDEQRVTKSGDLKNLDQARKHLKKFGPGYLWFRRGGKQYVLRDGELLREVKQVARPEEDVWAGDAGLDREETELGRQPAKLPRPPGPPGPR